MLKKILLTIEVIIYEGIIIGNPFLNFYINKNILYILAIFICIFLTSNLRNRIIFIITFLADYNLIFSRNYVLGLCFFILAQSLRLKYFDKYKSSNNIIIISIITTIILSLLINPLIALAISYSILLSYNTFLSFKTKNKKNQIGMVLFVLCDICVAISFLLPNQFLFNKLVWIFYIPSAVFLSIAKENK